MELEPGPPVQEIAVLKFIVAEAEIDEKLDYSETKGKDHRKDEAP